MSVIPSRQSAFTIVELLIVIVVIAILAGISIVAFNGVQSRARASAASSALTQSIKKIALWQIDNPNTAPDCDKFKELTNSTGASCTGEGVKVGSITYQYTPSTSTLGTYCITATNGTTSYTATGTTAPVSGTCGGHGAGGLQAITNLVTNPSFENSLPGGAVYNVTSTQVAGQGVTSGTQALRLHSTRTANGEAMRFVQGSFTNLGGLTAGNTYTLSGDMTVLGTFATNQSEQRQICLRWDGPSGRACSQQAPNNSSTTRLFVTATIPSGATGAMIQLNHYGISTDPDIIIDSLIITEGSTNHAFADGNSNGWIWNGSPNTSTSTGSPF